MIELNHVADFSFLDKPFQVYAMEIDATEIPGVDSSFPELPPTQLLIFEGGTRRLMCAVSLAVQANIDWEASKRDPFYTINFFNPVSQELQAAIIVCLYDHFALGMGQLQIDEAKEGLAKYEEYRRSVRKPNPPMRLVIE